MGTLSCELHHNLILLSKYPDAQIYLQHNSSYIFYVKICMTRWNELWGNRRVLALLDDTWWPHGLCQRKMERLWMGGGFFCLCYLFCSFWFMKTTTCMWKAKHHHLPLERLQFFCGHLKWTHCMSEAGLGTDDLILFALLLEMVRVLSTEPHAVSPPQSELPCWSMDKRLEAWRGQDHFTVLCAKALRAVLYPQSLKPLVH